MKKDTLAEKPTPTKIRRLSHKQKGFVKAIAKGKTGVQAALENYDTDYNTARAIASENLTKPSIIKALHEYLPDELLTQVHLEGLQAVNQWENPDYATRHRYLDSAYKLKGSYAAERSINLQVNYTPDAKSVALANEFEDKLKGELQ